jgi:hypothetical protein
LRLIFDDLSQYFIAFRPSHFSRVSPTAPQ